MSRSFHQFDCEGARLAGTLDQADGATGLLILSGGNEIRSGAHSGMARLAQILAREGFPVFRLDRRGIGESGGENGEFLSSEPDIAAAVEQFRRLCPSMSSIAAFGNCDAATALAMFGPTTGIERLILANPWVIEESNSDDGPVTPPPAAIRARYWKRLTNPRTIIDLFKGQIDLRKLLTGIKQATQKQENSNLSLQLRDALQDSSIPIRILLAEQDTTAVAFTQSWTSADYETVRSKANIKLDSIKSASHSFADEDSRNWLEGQILEALRSPS